MDLDELDEPSIGTEAEQSTYDKKTKLLHSKKLLDDDSEDENSRAQSQGEVKLDPLALYAQTEKALKEKAKEKVDREIKKSTPKSQPIPSPGKAKNITFSFQTIFDPWKKKSGKPGKLPE